MLSMKRDFLAVESWSDDEVDGILGLAARVKRGEVQRRARAAASLALVFLDPSLRTRTSFEAGDVPARRPGHRPSSPGRGSWAMETEPDVVMDGATVEHLIEAARVLGRYADALGAALLSARRRLVGRRARTRVLADFARHCQKPVINLESARRHPCQELADGLTLRETLGRHARAGASC